MRVLIVDDESLARRGVSVRLRKIAGVQIIGECDNGPSAVRTILELAPDLVFLDVQMPGMDGFGVLRSLPRDRLPDVIFLTAYEQYTLRAFEVHALDYLLKPIDDRRFHIAVERAQTHAASKRLLSERVVKLFEERSAKSVTRFTVRSGSRLEIVLAREIQWVGAARDYVELHTRNGSYLLRETMNALEHKLDPSEFIRIHRSRIVRSACIRELRAIENREFIVKLLDQSEHRSSRTYADRLEYWLSSERG